MRWTAALVLLALLACKKSAPAPKPEPSASPTGRHSFAVFAGAEPQLCWEIAHPDPELAAIGVGNPKAIHLTGSCKQFAQVPLGTCDAASGLYVWHVYDRKLVAREKAECANRGARWEGP